MLSKRSTRIYLATCYEVEVVKQEIKRRSEQWICLLAKIYRVLVGLAKSCKVLSQAPIPGPNQKIDVLRFSA
jgi:hypothetical protein